MKERHNKERNGEEGIGRESKRKKIRKKGEQNQWKRYNDVLSKQRRVRYDTAV
jgi:hypothetical protein